MLRRPLARGLARPLLSPASICPSCSHTLRRTLVGSRQTPDRRADLDTLNVDRIARQYKEYHRTRQQILSAGAVAGVISIVYLCWKISQKLGDDDGEQARKGATQLDSAQPAGNPIHDINRKVVKHDEQGREVVRTGNSTVPEFPRTLELPATFTKADDAAAAAAAEAEAPGGVPHVTSTLR